MIQAHGRRRWIANRSINADTLRPQIPLLSPRDHGLKHDVNKSLVVTGPDNTTFVCRQQWDSKKKLIVTLAQLLLWIVRESKETRVCADTPVRARGRGQLDDTEREGKSRKAPTCRSKPVKIAECRHKSVVFVNSKRASGSSNARAKRDTREHAPFFKLNSVQCEESCTP
eukprot:4966823-Pleurochrysis_carterae.AAC.1